MILNELKRYIEENGIVSRSAIAKKFSLSEDGVDAMLAVWIKKVYCRALSIPTRLTT